MLIAVDLWNMYFYANIYHKVTVRYSRIFNSTLSFSTQYSRNFIGYGVFHLDASWVLCLWHKCRHLAISVHIICVTYLYCFELSLSVSVSAFSLSGSLSSFFLFFVSLVLSMSVLPLSLSDSLSLSPSLYLSLSLSHSLRLPLSTYLKADVETALSTSADNKYTVYNIIICVGPIIHSHCWKARLHSSPSPG